MHADADNITDCQWIIAHGLLPSLNPRNSILRLKSLTRRSSTHETQALITRSSSTKHSRRLLDSKSVPVVDNRALVHEFPHFPSPSSSHTRCPTDRSLSDARRVDNLTSIFSESDPFRSIRSPEESLHRTELAEAVHHTQEEVLDPNSILPSPPDTCFATPASITPSLAVSSVGLNPIRRSLKRLKDFTKGNFSVSHNPPEVCQILPSESTRHPRTPPQSRNFVWHLPELSFDTTPLSSLIPQEHEYTPDTSVAEQDHHEISSPALRPSCTQTARFPLIKWERVNPNELTPSPYTILGTDLSPAETPLLPIPSPSWLSRNTRDIEFGRTQPPPTIQIAPPSPAPLPILPRSLLPVISRPIYAADSLSPKARFKFTQNSE